MNLPVRLRVWVFGFRVWGIGVEGWGFRCLGFRSWGLDEGSLVAEGMRRVQSAQKLRGPLILNPKGAEGPRKFRCEDWGFRQATP